MSESNFRCKCGEPLYKNDDILHHTIYHCLACNEFYVVKGQDHYWLVDEIDIATGQIIPMEQTEKGKIHIQKENERLKRLYGNKLTVGGKQT
jgi:hypothetical protein